MISAFFTKILVAFAVVLTILSVCAWLHEKGIRPLASLRKMSLVGICALGLWAAPFIQYGSTKGGGGTNNVPQMSVGNVANVGMLPISITNSNVSATASYLGQLETGNIGTGNTSTLATLITSTNTSRVISAEYFERGFIQTRIGTDEEFDFSPIANATIVSDWRAFGAANASVKCKM